MVKIGHASIDENGKIQGGAAGDQTGKEVCTRDYYYHTKGWCGLRAKDSDVAEKIAKCMEDACANPYIGYDQSGRLTLYNTVKNLKFKCDMNTLKVKVECDCSSLVRVCLAYAGVTVGNFNTAGEKAVILKTGLFEEFVVKKDGSNLKRGDILVTKTKGHTVVVLSDGSAASSSTVEYYPAYTGTSSNLDTILKAIGVPSQYIKDKAGENAAVRKPLAVANGISDYTGTTAQNSKLKKLAKQGKLVRV